MLSSPIAHIPFSSSVTDQLIQHGLLASGWPQNTAQALDVLADAAAARNDNPDTGLRDVNALVQHRLVTGTGKSPARKASSEPIAPQFLYDA